MCESTDFLLFDMDKSLLIHCQEKHASNNYNIFECSQCACLMSCDLTVSLSPATMSTWRSTCKDHIPHTHTLTPYNNF